MPMGAFLDTALKQTKRASSRVRTVQPHQSHACGVRSAYSTSEVMLNMQSEVMLNKQSSGGSTSNT